MAGRSNLGRKCIVFLKNKKQKNTDSAAALCNHNQGVRTICLILKFESEALNKSDEV